MCKYDGGLLFLFLHIVHRGPAAAGKLGQSQYHVVGKLVQTSNIELAVAFPLTETSARIRVDILMPPFQQCLAAECQRMCPVDNKGHHVSLNYKIEKDQIPVLVPELELTAVCTEVHHHRKPIR
jgi:hypothetical protein